MNTTHTCEMGQQSRVRVYGVHYMAQQGSGEAAQLHLGEVERGSVCSTTTITITTITIITTFTATTTTTAIHPTISLTTITVHIHPLLYVLELRDQPLLHTTGHQVQVGGGVSCGDSSGGIGVSSVVRSVGGGRESDVQDQLQHLNIE